MYVHTYTQMYALVYIVYMYVFCIIGASLSEPYTSQQSIIRRSVTYAQSVDD